MSMHVNLVHSKSSISLAVVLPCYNEALTIAKVVQDFATALPSATIYVFDNASTDETAALAQRAGAKVLRAARQRQRCTSHALRGRRRHLYHGRW